MEHVSPEILSPKRKVARGKSPSKLWTSPPRRPTKSKATLKKSKKKALASATSHKKVSFERPRSPTDDNGDGTRLASEEPLNLSTPFVSQISVDSGSQSADVDFDRTPSATALTPQQQREHRFRFQRQRALKSVGKFNLKLNQQRVAERKYYYDLQTNIVHVPRRPVDLLPVDDALAELQIEAREFNSFQKGSRLSENRGIRETGAYPAALMAHPPQYVDSITMFSPTQLEYFPLKTATNHASSFAMQCLKMSAEEYQQLGSQEDFTDPVSSDDESVQFSDDERERTGAMKVLDAMDVSEAEDNATITDATTEASAPSSHHLRIKLKKRPGRKLGFRFKKPEVASPASAARVFSDSSEKPPHKIEYSPEIKPPPTRVPHVPEPSISRDVSLDRCYVCQSKTHPEMKQEIEAKKVDEEWDTGLQKKKVRPPAYVMDPAILAKENLVRCTKCRKEFHPSCVGLPKATILRMKQYPWECSDCKTCNKCNKSTQEEKIMFCDLCDRGFHSFCVGVPKIPCGRWLCEPCAVCTLCGSAKVNEEGKRGRACIWQLEHDADAAGNATAVRVLCYPCFKRQRFANKGRLPREGDKSAPVDDIEE